MPTINALGLKMLQYLHCKIHEAVMFPCAESLYPEPII